MPTNDYDDDDDDDGPAEDMEAYEESGKLEAEDEVLKHRNGIVQRSFYFERFLIQSIVYKYCASKFEVFRSLVSTLCR